MITVTGCLGLILFGVFIGAALSFALIAHWDKHVDYEPIPNFDAPTVESVSVDAEFLAGVIAAEETAQAKAEQHITETWRRGYGDDLRFGWHCLTCSVEREMLPALDDDAAMAAAEQGARNHRLDTFAGVA